MSEKSPAERLREIASRLRHLPQNRAYKNRLPGPLSRRAGQLFDEAVKLGAFGGPEHEELRELLDRAHHFYPSKWEDVVWIEAVGYLCPELYASLGPVGSIVPACGPIADLTDVEAAKLEAGLTDNEDKWSSADSPAEFRKQMGMSATTFYRKRKSGEIRTRKVGGSSKSIQVHLDDLKKLRK